MREIKNSENRVGVTPAGVWALCEHGHTALVETGAGTGSGLGDAEYAAMGAELVDTAEEAWRRADIIVKVKEPLPSEYPLLQKDKVLFTYLHLAPNPGLTKALLYSGTIGMAYETVQAGSHLPLLEPMSEVAGRMATFMGATYLAYPQGGIGVLMSGVPGVAPANVLVLGGGTVGTNAARVAAGTGAQVTILELDPARQKYLDDIMPSNCVTLHSDRANLEGCLPQADLVIGGVLLAGRRAPWLITRDMLQTMKPRAVIVDVAVDQGGCVETTVATSHEDPVYYADGILHYCVANMPGAYPRTSTLALTSVTLPYVLALADMGAVRAVKSDEALAAGANIWRGKLTHADVADSLGMDYVPLAEAI